MTTASNPWKRTLFFFFLVTKIDCAYISFSLFEILNCFSSMLFILCIPYILIERDGLRKDIEQLCIQQAGPSYLVVATKMHFQRYTIFFFWSTPVEY